MRQLREGEITKGSLIKVYLVLNQRVSTQSCCSPHFSSITSGLIERHSELELDGGGLERGGGVDPHPVPSQVLVCGSWVEGTSNLD